MQKGDAGDAGGRQRLGQSNAGTLKEKNEGFRAIRIDFLARHLNLDDLICKLLLNLTDRKRLNQYRRETLTQSNAI